MKTDFLRFLSENPPGLSLEDRFVRATQYREQYGISQVECAREMGSKKSVFLCEVEQGTYPVTEKYLQRYLAAVDALIVRRLRMIHYLKEGMANPRQLAVR